MVTSPFAKLALALSSWDSSDCRIWFTCCSSTSKSVSFVLPFANRELTSISSSSSKKSENAKRGRDRRLNGSESALKISFDSSCCQRIFKY